MSNPHTIPANLDDLKVVDSIKLCTSAIAGKELAWLELTMPRSLFDGSNLGGGITAFIGARSSDGKSWKCIDKRAAGYSHAPLTGEISSLLALQKFQKAIVEEWKKFDEAKAGNWAKGTTIGKSHTSPSFVAKALKTGFDAIGLAQSAYSGAKFSDWTLKDLRKYAESRKKTFEWRDKSLAAFSDVSTKFLELTPDPALAQAEDEAIHNPDRSMPARNIDYIRSARSSGHSGKFAYSELDAKINLPRVIGYGFRGDSRDPVKLRKEFSGAFLPNYTRTNQNARVQAVLAYAVNADINKLKLRDPGLYNEIERVRSKDVERVQRMYQAAARPAAPGGDNTRRLEAIQEVIKNPANADKLRAIYGQSKPGLHPDFTGAGGQIRSVDKMNTGALDLGEYVINEYMGGYVSVSRSVTVAKSFACGRGGNSEKGNREGWVYVCFVEGAFNMPLRGTHPLAQKQEFELAMPGMLEWEDLVGWRKVGIDGYFSGPVYLRDSLCQSDPRAFNEIYKYLSGKRQTM